MVSNHQVDCFKAFFCTVVYTHKKKTVLRRVWEKKSLYSANDGIACFGQLSRFCVNVQAYKNLFRKTVLQKIAVAVIHLWSRAISFLRQCSAICLGAARVALSAETSSGSRQLQRFCIWLGHRAAQCLPCFVQALPCQRASAGHQLVIFPFLWMRGQRWRTSVLSLITQPTGVLSSCK